jgi:hypothetical protein
MIITGGGYPMTTGGLSRQLLESYLLILRNQDTVFTVADLYNKLLSLVTRESKLTNGLNATPLYIPARLGKHGSIPLKAMADRSEAEDAFIALLVGPEDEPKPTEDNTAVDNTRQEGIVVPRITIPLVGEGSKIASMPGTLRRCHH